MNRFIILLLLTAACGKSGGGSPATCGLPNASYSNANTSLEISGCRYTLKDPGPHDICKLKGTFETDGEQINFSHDYQSTGCHEVEPTTQCSITQETTEQITLNCPSLGINETMVRGKK